MQQETETRPIASARVHVERAIERVKNYRILQSVFQLTMAQSICTHNLYVYICTYMKNNSKNYMIHYLQIILDVFPLISKDLYKKN